MNSESFAAFPELLDNQVLLPYDEARTPDNCPESERGSVGQWFQRIHPADHAAFRDNLAATIVDGEIKGEEHHRILGRMAGVLRDYLDHPATRLGEWNRSDLESYYETLAEQAEPTIDESAIFRKVFGPKFPEMFRRTRKFNLQSAGDLSRMPPLTWLIKGVLPAQGVGAMFGGSSDGKSFAAKDMSFKLAAGLEWFGHRTFPVPAIYVALEGAAGISKRIAAYRRKHGEIPDQVHFVTPASFDLRNPDDVKELAASIREKSAHLGLVIIDTLNRAAPGMDENSSSDMGAAIAGASELQRLVGGLVLLVHHSGKDSSKGLRGHSSLHAALDVVIQVSRDGDRREWRLAKSKDGEDGKAHPFRLEVVDLGIDEDGDPITSCVIQPEENPSASVARARVPKGGNQKIIFDALKELLRETQEFGKGGAAGFIPCVELEMVVSTLRDRITCEPRRKTERTREAITGLVSNGLVRLREGWLWIEP